MTNFMRIRVSINTVGNKPQRKKLGVRRKKKKKGKANNGWYEWEKEQVIGIIKKVFKPVNGVSSLPRGVFKLLMSWCAKGKNTKGERIVKDMFGIYFESVYWVIVYIFYLTSECL